MQPRLQTEGKPTGGRSTAGTSECVRDSAPAHDADLTPVRIGLVGYGFGGRWFHATMLAAAPECDFGVVTSSPERREQVAADHPGLATYASVEALAAPVEAVAISTPADTRPN